MTRIAVANCISRAFVVLNRLFKFFLASKQSCGIVRSIAVDEMSELLADGSFINDFTYSYVFLKDSCVRVF